MWESRTSGPCFLKMLGRGLSFFWCWLKLNSGLLFQLQIFRQLSLTEFLGFLISLAPVKPEFASFIENQERFLDSLFHLSIIGCVLWFCIWGLRKTTYVRLNDGNFQGYSLALALALFLLYISNHPVDVGRFLVASHELFSCGQIELLSV